MDRYRASAIGLAIISGLGVFGLTNWLFPFHSLNHDEAVYLQQAAMLVDGQLVLRPPVPQAMRPWFFVREGATLYPKYTPVPAAAFAVGNALTGSYRVTLAGIAAINVLLTYRLVETVFDRRHGIVAAVVLTTSPLFLIDSSVFLPYALTFALELGFALGYIRAVRTGRPGLAVLAGAAIGLAFFARPYTALLFAVPFLGHAAWQLTRPDFERRRQRALVTIGIVGSVFVGFSFGYNALLTGDPLLFPYEAFAPRDGLGFGRRSIVGYERVYTPWLAVRATMENLAVFVGRWIPAGPIAAVIGLIGVYSSIFTDDGNRSPDPHRIGGLPLVIVGIVPSVIIGEAYFWGTLNVLGQLDVPGDGLIAVLGPYYHFDLLLPTTAFVAAGVIVGWEHVIRLIEQRSQLRLRPIRIGLSVLMISGLLITTAGIATPAVTRNMQVRDAYAVGYQPIFETEFDHAIVLLPTPYGDWLNHPFQLLRNDPTYDGPVVYALRDTAPWALAEAYPNRTIYRYGYRGRWYPLDGAVEPILQPVSVAGGERVRLTVRFGVPAPVERTSARVASGNETAYYHLRGEGAIRTMTVLLTPAHVAVSGDGITAIEQGDVSMRGANTIDLEVFLTTGASGFSYRASIPVRTAGGQVMVMTPTLEVCRDPRLCGGEATYIPGHHRKHVWINTSLSAS